MDKLLQLVGGENSLLSAYESMVSGKTAVADGALQDEYARYFRTEVTTGSVDAKALEKFSLTDPSIRTVIASSTAA